MEIKQLNPNEYDNDRIKAMKEIYGENWKDKLQEQVTTTDNKNKLRDKLAEMFIEMLNEVGIVDKKQQRSIFNYGYLKCK